MATTKPDSISLWSSSQHSHESGELRFSGFEPCLIACIKDLEGRISAILDESVENGNNGIPGGISELLLQYSMHITLSAIERSR